MASTKRTKLTPEQKADRKRLNKLIEKENRRNPETNTYSGGRWQILGLIVVFMGIMVYGFIAG